MDVEKSPDNHACATDADFDKFKAEADDTAGWDVAFKDKDGKLFVWSKKSDPINIVKVLVHFKNIEPEVLYDTLHDAEYRAVWDENMIEGKVIQQLDAFNEIGYYSAKADKGEWIIFNHSVNHKDMPEKKGFIRAWSILTGYLVRRSAEGGCSLTYLTQSDPRGWFPGWLINMMTTKFAPKILEKMEKAAIKYPDWKAKHNPENKPWLKTA